ncbi:tetratricopeptide repeat protein [Corallincola platygyrae]|uniref:Tetratricopeptide repeat protein n=1 Tax=Corallincola platygyrae TaxID=1193278 RepID=A0ABW4XQF5_9GAMM
MKVVLYPLLVPVFAALVFSLFSLLPSAHAAGSGFELAEKEPSQSVQLYNQGVEHMMAKRFPAAEQKFRDALALDDKFSKAHNNLAYSLRKQGKTFYGEALFHYSRAIQLSPKLSEAYMYRGVLFIQMGNKQKALADHDVLLEMDQALATELAYVVEHGKEKEPEQFFGVSGAIE